MLFRSLVGYSIKRTNQGVNEDHHSWSSNEDQKNFYQHLDKSPLVIMGSRTYEGAKKNMVHKDGRMRIVLTSNPKKYEGEKIPGKLEFTNENPKELIKRLEKSGIKKGILVGGATTNTKFFKQNLVTEVWQTIEPILRGVGINTAVEKIDISLKLISSEKLNARGTFLLKYSVVST